MPEKSIERAAETCSMCRGVGSIGEPPISCHWCSGKKTIQRYTHSGAPQPVGPVVTDEMVNRFLSWPLPKDFCPDCGISFDGRKDDRWNTNKTWPVGTNLFTAEQAQQMLEHALGVK